MIQRSRSRTCCAVWIMVVRLLPLERVVFMSAQVEMDMVGRQVHPKARRMLQTEPIGRRICMSIFHERPNLCAAANPAGASRLQSLRLVRRVAELGSFGDMKDQLTAFQLEVEKGINDVLDHLGKHVVDRRVAGIEETYITGSVSDQ